MNVTLGRNPRGKPGPREHKSQSAAASIYDTNVRRRWPEGYGGSRDLRIADSTLFITISVKGGRK
jgi:hypothetical protein